MLKSFHAYELLNSDEKETVNSIILEALSRSGYDINDIDYEIKTHAIG